MAQPPPGLCRQPRRLVVAARGRILIISPWSQLWSLAPGAGVSDESQMLPRLIQHGYEIHMLIPRATDSMQPEPGLHVHEFANVLRVPEGLPAPLKRLWLLPAFWTIAARAGVRLAREVRPRLVMGFSHYGAWPAYRAARVAGVPSVLKLFGVMHATRLEWRLPRYLYHSLEGVLAFKVPLSHFILLNDGTRGEAVARRWGVQPQRITYLPNGIDKEWAEWSLDDREFRRELGTPDDTVVFLALSRLVLSKRVDRIIAGVQAATARSRKPLQLWVAGDGPLRGELESQARALGSRCVFLGTIARSRIPSLLASADALVSTSTLTNMSIPTCEAMVLGRPVIALDVGGTSEVVQPGRTGLLVEEHDPEALADAIVSLAEDAELRSRLGQEARQFAARNFMSWDERVAAEIALLDRLADSPGPGETT